MFKQEILVGEGLRAVDGGAACAVAVEEVAALDHEVFDYAVEFGSFVSLWSALGVAAGLAGAELAEVFGGAGRGAGEKFDLDSSQGFAWLFK